MGYTGKATTIRNYVKSMKPSVPLGLKQQCVMKANLEPRFNLIGDSLDITISVEQEETSLNFW